MSFWQRLSSNISNCIEFLTLNNVICSLLFEDEEAIVVMMIQSGVQLTSANVQNPLRQQQQQQQMNTPIDSDDENSGRDPNLPPLNLLTGSRDDYLTVFPPLYKASIICDWKTVEDILENRRNLVKHSITENGETILHVAASANVPKKIGEEFVKNLVDLMEKEDLTLENKNFNTALYLAAAAGNLEMVKIMVQKNQDLLTIPGAGGQMPLNVAALFGKNDVVQYLYENSDDLCDAAGWTDVNRGWLLEKCVENNMFEMALQIVEKYPELGRRGSVLGILAQKPDALTAKRKYNFFIRRVIDFLGLDEMVDLEVEALEGPALQLLRFILDDIVKLPTNEIDSILIRGPNAIKQANKLVSGKVDQALELQKLISEHTVNMHVETLNILEQDPNKSTSIKRDQAVQIEKVVSEHITKMQVKIRDIIRGPAAKDTHSSKAPFAAAEMGNIIFLAELIRRYPDIMWKVNDSNQTIFHIAVENRQVGIYTMLYEIGHMKDSITSLNDENGNNMLHLVAKIAKKKKLEQVRGVLFQMQRELFWFKKVESMIKPSCRERRNKDGLTPQELFTKEHEDLLAQSVKWVKVTSNQCMVVAALVATIAFAAAITSPGGYKQDSGYPVFYRDKGYTIFILLDAISLFTSSISILLFINILTSRYAERDFLTSIPKKFVLFISTLIFSIYLMILSFTSSFSVIYHKEMVWIRWSINVIASLFVGYLGLQYISISFQSIYSSEFLFKFKKHVLYYKNPVH